MLAVLGLLLTVLGVLSVELLDAVDKVVTVETLWLLDVDCVETVLTLLSDWLLSVDVLDEDDSLCELNVDGLDCVLDDKVLGVLAVELDSVLWELDDKLLLLNVLLLEDESELDEERVDSDDVGALSVL